MESSGVRFGLFVLVVDWEFVVDWEGVANGFLVREASWTR